MTERELAWAAGCFEGEGCISINREFQKNRTYYRLRVSLPNTDEDIIKFFQSRWPGTVHIEKSRGNSRQLSRWILTSKKAEKCIAQLCAFFITEKYKNRAELAFQFMEAKRNRDLELEQVLYARSRILNRVGVDN